MKSRSGTNKDSPGSLAGVFPQLVKQIKARGLEAGKNGRREAIAEFCRLLGQELTATPSAANMLDSEAASLSPRLRETLEHLLRGDAEKQIAAKLGLSQHTIHVYVKALHKHYSVSSRSELLARFISRG